MRHYERSPTERSCVTFVFCFFAVSAFIYINTFEHEQTILFVIPNSPTSASVLEPPRTTELKRAGILRQLSKFAFRPIPCNVSHSSSRTVHTMFTPIPTRLPLKKMGTPFPMHADLYVHDCRSAIVKRWLSTALMWWLFLKRHDRRCCADITRHILTVANNSRIYFRRHREQ